MNLDITQQGVLAKLLAAENISIHVGNYDTAFFDVKRRILGLPTWNFDDKSISDTLIGHEVGHALFTPPDAIDTFKKKCPGIPFSLFNIIEDVRIEKLIKSKFPGLITSFREAYQLFLDKDIFKIKGKSVDNLRFIDRINIKAKCGNLININFSLDEAEIFNRILEVEYIEEAYILCQELYDFEKQKYKEDPENNIKSSVDDTTDGTTDGTTGGTTDGGTSPDFGISNTSSNDDDDDDDDTSNDADAADADADADDAAADDAADEHVSPKRGVNAKSNTNIASDSGGDSDNSMFESETYKAFDDNIKKSVSIDSKTSQILPPTKDDYNFTIIDFNKYIESKKSSSEYCCFMETDNHYTHDQRYKRWRAQTKQIIQPMISKFESQKSAFRNSNAKISKTGELDMNRLSSYKFSDNIFKSNMTLKDHKNHGLILFIDNSRSMIDTMASVYEQILNITMFCKSVHIPFKVYLFSSGHQDRSNHKKIEDDKITFLDYIYFSGMFLTEILSSEMSRSQFDLACRILFIRSSGSVNFMSTDIDRMGSTPLNHTVILAHKIVKDFKKKYGIDDKMNVMFITDGMSNQFTVGTAFLDDLNRSIRKMNITLNNRRVEMPINRASPHDVFSATSITYANLIHNLRVTCKTNVIGFYIINSKSVRVKQNTLINSIKYSTSYKRKYKVEDVKPLKNTDARNEANEHLESFRKENYVIIPEGYSFNHYFLLNPKALLINNTYTSTDPKKKINHLQNFKKENRQRKRTRIILSKFIQSIS